LLLFEDIWIYLGDGGAESDQILFQMQGVALSPNDSSTQNELFDGMSTGTARIIIEREVSRQISEEFNNASSDATQIIDAIFDILEKFVGEVKIEDDITSVIIKMQN
jgi:hypothetical protein